MQWECDLETWYPVLGERRPLKLGTQGHTSRLESQSVLCILATIHRAVITYNLFIFLWSSLGVTHVKTNVDSQKPLSFSKTNYGLIQKVENLGEGMRQNTSILRTSLWFTHCLTKPSWGLCSISLSVHTCPQCGDWRLLLNLQQGLCRRGNQ